MENKPIASVCLAVYNGQEFLREAIESVLAQTFKDFELIISDDGSKDESYKICEEYQKKDPRVIYIRHNINRGGFWNNNFLLEQARGEYVTFLSQDDALKERFLEKTVPYLKNNPECNLVSGDFEFINTQGVVTETEELDRIRKTVEFKKRIREFFRYPTSQVCLCLYGLMRGKVAKEIYPRIKFSEKIVKGSDLQLVSRFAVSGDMVSLPIPLRKFRFHGDSAYHKEVARLKGKNIFTRRFILLQNLYGIRFDQLKVLWTSKFPLIRKLDITVFVYARYIKTFFKRIVFLPAKAYRVIKKEDRFA